MTYLQEAIIDLKAQHKTGGVKIRRLNEYKKDINTVSLLIDMLKKAKAEHGDFQVLVSNDGETIHIFPDKD